MKHKVLHVLYNECINAVKLTSEIQALAFNKKSVISYSGQRLTLIFQIT